MLRAFAYLGRNPGTPISDMPQFTFGLFHGDSSDLRPDGEPSAA